MGNILLWYLPFAVFSGACDLMLSESDMQTNSERPAEIDDDLTPGNLDIATVAAR
jgi:hypothetical protein